MDSWKQRNQSLAPLPSSCAGDLVLGQGPLALECRLLSVWQSSPFNPSPKRKAHIFALNPEVTLDSWDSRASQHRPSPTYGQLSTRAAVPSNNDLLRTCFIPSNNNDFSRSPCNTRTKSHQGDYPQLNYACLFQSLFWLDSKLLSVPEDSQVIRLFHMSPHPMVSLIKVSPLVTHHSSSLECA